MISGILPINKPAGISSARVVSRVKKITGAKKVGHTGTLDPFATGLLLCAINKGTRISSYFLGGNKRYTARICFGKETDTYDRTGEIVNSAPENEVKQLDPKQLEDIALSFIGVQQQIAPAYSALKHKGQPLYKLARQGKKVQKPPREIEILDIRIIGVDLPFMDIDVTCSSGTYIRSLAFDMGRKAGCGAHLSELCRTGSGRFSLDQSIDLETLSGLDQGRIEEQMTSLNDCLEFLPHIVVSSEINTKIRYGQVLTVDETGRVDGDQKKDPEQKIRLIDNSGNLLALVTLSDTGQTYNYSCVFLS